MQSSPQSRLSPEFVEAFRSVAPDGRLYFQDAISLALYHPQIGYYASQKERVGRRQGTDFYTASSLGSVFSRLVLAAIGKLSGQADLSQWHFVEFGSEHGQTILDALDDVPFASSTPVGYQSGVNVLQAFTGQPIVLFSNELFDARPFQRFVGVDGAYRPLALSLSDDDQLSVYTVFQEAERPVHQAPEWSPATALPSPIEQLDALPVPPGNGYILDYPIGAHCLMEQLVTADWEGLFVTFDYGLEAATLFNERPAGTARAYLEHQLFSDPFHAPGKADITHHVNWTDLANQLSKAGFEQCSLESQEQFFIHHAQSAIAAVVSGKIGLDRDKQTLMELIHPHHMGTRFQCLHGRRIKAQVGRPSARG